MQKKRLLELKRENVITLFNSVNLKEFFLKKRILLRFEVGSLKIRSKRFIKENFYLIEWLENIKFNDFNLF